MNQRTRYCRIAAICLLGCLLLVACNFPGTATSVPPTSRPTATAHATSTPPPTLTATVTSVPTDAPRPRLSESADIIEVVPNVTLDVELFYYERWMRVHQTIDLTNTSPDVWNEVVFNDPINALPDTFLLDAVKVTIGEDSQQPLVDQSHPILHIPLPHEAKPGEAIQIEMNYRVVIPPISPTDWPPNGTTGWRFGVIQAGEWYPAIVPYVAGQGWHTWDYRAVGDPTVYPLENMKLNVKTDGGIMVASGGALGQDANGVWHFEVNAARGIAFLASERFESTQGEANGIPITSYYQPEHAAAGEAALQITSEAIQLYEKLYGPYPYKSLVVAENGFFGGMEYSGLISITDYAYVIYTGETPSLLQTLVAHETAHQWWYGAVGNDQANEPWLDESLAFYSELLYFEHYAPDDVDWWWQNRVDVYNPHGPVDASIYTYGESSDFITSMYGQAARFLRDLRKEMGDEAFFAFLQDYYRTYSGQIITGHEFKTMAQAHTDHDLTPLFQAYFANPNP